MVDHESVILDGVSLLLMANHILFIIRRYDSDLMTYRVFASDSNHSLVFRWHGVWAYFPFYITYIRLGTVPVIFSGLALNRRHFHLGALHLRHLGVCRHCLIHMDCEYAWSAF